MSSSAAADTSSETTSASASTNVPPGVNMPKKKDPRLRNLQAPPPREFFDSAEYEVQKHRAQNDKKLQSDLRTAAMSREHPGVR
jgi:hypothetical protein